MPIKLPKGFQRRKSSGPALEDIPNPPEPSFRVFERPHNAGKSFDSGHVLQKSEVAVDERTVVSPRVGIKDDNEPLFPISRADLGKRNSTWTDNSISTKAPYSSAASSARLSSSSTIPSSTDTRSDISAASGNPKPFHDIPVPPRPVPRPPFSLRSSARTFSFGSRTGGSSAVASQTPPTALPRAGSMASTSRDRALSASTASTATPPKLLDAELAFGDNDVDGFSNMFDNIGKLDNRNGAPRQDLSGNAVSSSLASHPGRPDHLLPPRVTTPLSVTMDRSQAVQSSPYSQNSQTSQDEVMHAPSRLSSDLGGRSLPPLPGDVVVAPHVMPTVVSTTENDVPEQPGQADTQHASKSPPQSHNITASLPSDFMRRRRQSFQQARRLDRKGSGAPSIEVPLQKTTSRTSNADSIQKSDAASPPPSPTLAAGALLAVEWERKDHRQPVKPSSKPKVMNAAQFERYRQQQEVERRRTEADKSDQSDADSDHYEDEDEAERDRQAMAQRRKQEAQLAVYRQTMMKVTGEQPVQSRTGSTDRLSARIPSSGSLDLSKSTSHLALDPKTAMANGKSSGDEDEDEDVPLGILAAHGFPNRNRPPTRLTNQSSSPNLRAASGAASVAGESKPTLKGGLPPFARHLPQDPYYGASLVNPSNRESFAMGGGSSVHGGPLLGTPPGLHPAGLVGIIAGEERARAKRRGSPNPTGSYDMPPGMMRAHTMGTIPTVPAPGMVPGMALPLTASDQAQIQMSQQMTQMMQMQMQWMQQMSQLVQQGQAPTMPPPPQFMQPQGAAAGAPGLLAPPGQNARPVSTPMPMPMPDVGSPRWAERTMSSLTPGIARWNRPPSFAPVMPGPVPGGGPGYAPSIAPSERSNVGLASRYRPVSMAPADGLHPAAKRSSTITSATVQPSWTNGGAGRRSPGVLSSLRAVGGLSSTDAKTTARAVPDDDDDEQGWAEMKKKKDKKKSTWKMKRSQTQGPGLEDLYTG